MFGGGMSISSLPFNKSFMPCLLREVACKLSYYWNWSGHTLLLRGNILKILVFVKGAPRGKISLDQVLGISQL